MAMFSLLFVGNKDELDKILVAVKAGQLHNFGEVGPRESKETEKDGKKGGGNVNIRFPLDPSDSEGKRILYNALELKHTVKAVDNSRSGHTITTDLVKTMRLAPPVSWMLYLGDVQPKREEIVKGGFIPMDEAIARARKV